MQRILDCKRVPVLGLLGFLYGKYHTLQLPRALEEFFPLFNCDNGLCRILAAFDPHSPSLTAGKSSGLAEMILKRQDRSINNR